MIYAGLILTQYLLFVCAFIKGANRRIISVLMVFVMMSFAALRFGVGADYEGYRSYFEKVGHLDFVFVEPLFYILLWLVNLVGGSFELFNFIFQIIFFCLLYFVISRNAAIPIVSFFVFFSLYFFGGPFGQMRQALAMILCLLGLHFFFREKVWSFYLCVLVAALTHYAALVFVCVPFLFKIKLRVLIVLFISAVLAAFLNFDLFEISRKFIYFPDSIVAYSASEKYGGAVDVLSLASIERVLVFTLALFCIHHRRDKNVLCYLKIYLASLILYFIFSEFSILAMRVSRYFKIVDVFLIAFIAQFFLVNRSNRLFVVVVSCILILKPAWQLSVGSDRYFPYESVFSKAL